MNIPKAMIHLEKKLLLSFNGLCNVKEIKMSDRLDAKKKK